LLLLLRVGIKYRSLLVLFGTIVAGVVINRAVLWDGAHSYDRMHMSLDTRADALLIGCFVSILAVNGLLPKKRWAIIALRLSAALSTLLLCFFVVGGVRNEPYYRYGVVTLTAICVGVVIADLMGHPFPFVLRLLSNPILVWTGNISYGLYLWHIPVFFLLGRDSAWSGLRIQSTRFIAVFVVAALSYYFIEKPFLKLKDKFAQSPKNTTVDEFVLVGEVSTTPAA
jgi:peptidoglycan/LPS O-acetylase OafA/YrhL